MHKKFTDEQIERLLSKRRLDNSERNLIRLPIAREVALRELVRCGKYRQIQVKTFQELQPNLGLTAKNPQKHCEFYTVAGITMMCRAAIDGGMNPDDAYDLSDVLLQELEQAETIDDIHDIFQLAGVAFAKAVFYANRKSNSYIIEQCKHYIRSNIYSKITTKDIGDYIGLSAKYVSRLFSQKEDITLHDYIQREKVNEACNLLKYSDRSISEIAIYLGFQSQSNFGVIFRKWKHMTPTEYRNQYFQETYHKK